MGVSGGEKNPKWLRDVNKGDPVFCCLSFVVSTSHTDAFKKCRLCTYMRTIYKPASFRGACAKVAYNLATLGKRVASLSSGTFSLSLNSYNVTPPDTNDTP